MMFMVHPLGITRYSEGLVKKAHFEYHFFSKQEIMKTTVAYYDITTGDPVNAHILEVKPHKDEGTDTLAVMLDRGIFYPEGGGQSADRGTINGIALLDVQEQDGELLHLVSAQDGGRLIPGPAELRLDAARRRDFTVHHTAQHLLSGTILRMTGSPTVSMHLGDDVCTIDVNTQDLSADTLIVVEEAVQDAIEGDHPVIIHRCPPENIAGFPLRKTPPQGEEVIRVVEIQGNDFSPCCGTHVKSTGQIGILRILGAEKYKGMTRVSFIAGRRVLRDSRRLRQNGDIASRALKVPVAEIGAGVLALVEKTARFERDLKTLQDDAARRTAEDLLRTAGLLDADARGRILIESFPAADMETVLRIGRAAQKRTAAVLVFGSEQEARFAAFCSLKGTDIRPLIKEPLEAQGGRGGGGPGFFQGVFASPEALKAFLAALPGTR
jgi:alanyl-tRNA synthetase